MGRRYLLFGLVLAVVVAMLPAQAAAAVTVTNVASGLHSPRGIAFVGGRMLVAESGLGGTDCFDGGPGVGPVCIGPTSRISWIVNGSPVPLVTGLFSESARGGMDTEGASGLSVNEGRILAQISTTPQEVPSPPTISPASFALGQAQAGRLIAVHKDGTWRTVAKVGEFDFNYTMSFPQPPGPGTQEHDANPTGVLATDEGAYVADSGANTLDRVNEEGRISIVIHDPTRFDVGVAFPTDAVPTCVVRSDDGGLLVGELSGRLLRVEGHSLSVISSPLLSHITGCTSDGHGNVYFVNMFGAGPVFVPPPASKFFIGNVVKYDTDSGTFSMLVDGLTLPNMDTIGPDGNLYVTVRSICPLFPGCGGATGGVIKVTLPHEDDQN